MMLRFLLPCNANGNREAIDAAIEVAHCCGATLVPLLLRSTVKKGNEEAAPQDNYHNFFEVVQHQAALMDVPIEEFEIVTHNAGRSIHVIAEEMECSGILLFVREQKGVLLESSEVRYVIEHEHSILPFLIHLLPQKRRPSLWSRISHRPRQKKDLETVQRDTAFPRWYPFALFAVGLSVAVLTGVNGWSLLQEPTFSLVSLFVKLIFICVIALSLVTLLRFFVDKWRQKQEE